MLDKRLRAAANFVPLGARLADIGSDHAYLPIALALENKIEYAIASDINEGPVSSAISNIAMNGLNDKIIAIRADGLDGVYDFAPNCITVLGMGGELIVSILDRAKWLNTPGITLILQPMTHGEILAKYLAREGFAVKDEIIVQENDRDDRIYRVICAEYDGVRREIDELEAYIGKHNLERRDRETVALVERNMNVLRTRINGKRQSGKDYAQEEKLYHAFESYLSR